MHSQKFPKLRETQEGGNLTCMYDVKQCRTTSLKAETPQINRYKEKEKIAAYEHKPSKWQHEFVA